MSNSKKTSSQNQKPSNTLSSIVSNLVRAAVGGNHHDVPDEDLDKYVADMIMKSASKTGKQYQSIGLRAYTDDENKAKLTSGVVIDRSDSNGLKTNKRFLSSIIKSTDDHNQALIRAEEKKAAEVAKELIADLDRRAVGRRKTSHGRDSRREGQSSTSRLRMDDIQASPSSNPRSTSPRWSRRLSSPSISPSPSPSRDVRVRGRGSKRYDGGHDAAPSSSSGSRLGSKMDKYFQEGYDPLMDTHSDDDIAVAKKHKKKEKKDRKSKGDKDHEKRRHKKHKSDKSSRSSSRKSTRRHESDSDDSANASDREHRRKSRHSSSSRRRHYEEELSDGERRKSKSSRSKSRRKESSDRDSSRSPSPVESRRHRSSHKSSRSSKEDEDRIQEKSSSRRKRRRDQTPTSDSSSDTDESDDDSHSKSKQSHSQPPVREWDLHKINKDAIDDQLFAGNRKENV
ncbi:hypothetical protein BGZ80_008464 [Entomortierella chlamydospora]|uniref:Uncharacterized protein n=1 Tax=Entomortierella chlamydospora TaxID=101097 RepID=A0A9P6N4L8_9FUNG|nr:hypothetical protein BGZ79_002642 [Entomortierella chlamydospora]KAG0023693.1 hypothetical protein BGZ80_008464 [Entomortierella chlamydospora]